MSDIQSEQMKAALKTAAKIRKGYLRNVAAAKKGREEAKPKQKILAPRDRPLNILKRKIYALARELEEGGASKALIRHVTRRDGKNGWHRPNRAADGTIIDWTVRLVMLPSRKKGTPTNDRKPLISAATQSRIIRELNYGYTYKISPKYVSMFIDEVGGYDMIISHKKPKPGKWHLGLIKQPAKSKAGHKNFSKMAKRAAPQKKVDHDEDWS